MTRFFLFNQQGTKPPLYPHMEFSSIRQQLPVIQLPGSQLDEFEALPTFHDNIDMP